MVIWCIFLSMFQPLESEVKAVGRGSKDRIVDGYMIHLDGSDSEREFANARWEVRA